MKMVRASSAVDPALLRREFLRRQFAPEGPLDKGVEKSIRIAKTELTFTGGIILKIISCRIALHQALSIGNSLHKDADPHFGRRLTHSAGRHPPPDR